jgi:hypothetical protein
MLIRVKHYANNAEGLFMQATLKDYFRHSAGRLTEYQRLQQTKQLNHKKNANQLKIIAVR